MVWTCYAFNSDDHEDGKVSGSPSRKDSPNLNVFVGLNALNRVDEKRDVDVKLGEAMESEALKIQNISQNKGSSTRSNMMEKNRSSRHHR